MSHFCQNTAVTEFHLFCKLPPGSRQSVASDQSTPFRADRHHEILNPFFSHRTGSIFLRMRISECAEG